jgi:multiple sugar transport system substrate-binding protein
VLDFFARSDLAIALVDPRSGWANSPNRPIVPVDELKKKFPSLIGPDLVWRILSASLTAFGSWNGVLYGLPFDNYSGLLYYNKEMLKAAGFDKPPTTWDNVNDYAPKLTGWPIRIRCSAAR